MEFAEQLLRRQGWAPETVHWYLYDFRDHTEHRYETEYTTVTWCGATMSQHTEYSYEAKNVTCTACLSCAAQEGARAIARLDELDLVPRWTKE